MIIKKISVCHGPTCGVSGGPAIKKRLEEVCDESIEITERACCGRCKDSCSIVINESTTISGLSVETLKEKFIANPESAISRAQEKEKHIRKELDSMLDADILA